MLYDLKIHQIAFLSMTKREAKVASYLLSGKEGLRDRITRQVEPWIFGMGEALRNSHLPHITLYLTTKLYVCKVYEFVSSVSDSKGNLEKNTSQIRKFRIFLRLKYLVGA